MSEPLPLFPAIAVKEPTLRDLKRATGGLLHRKNQHVHSTTSSAVAKKFGGEIYSQRPKTSSLLP
jgi:hypothetical protein